MAALHVLSAIQIKLWDFVAELKKVMLYIPRHISIRLSNKTMRIVTETILSAREKNFVIHLSAEFASVQCHFHDCPASAWFMASRLDLFP